MLYSNQRMLIGVNTCASVLAIISVALRFGSLQVKRLKPNIDDWLCLGALVSNMGQFTIVYIMILNGGAGKPPDKYTASETATFLRLTAIVQLFYGLTMGGTRASIAYLVLQIFGRSTPTRRVLKTTLVLTAAWTLFVILQTFAMCRPFAANWDKTIPGAKCGNEISALLGIVIWGLILDVVIFTVPIPHIWKLQMPKSRKTALIALFSIGLFDIITGIMRMVVTLEGVFTVISQALLWAILEPSIAIFVACAPKSRHSLDRLLRTQLFSQISLISFLRSKRDRSSESDTSSWSGKPPQVKASRNQNFVAEARYVPQGSQKPVSEGQVMVREDVCVESEANGVGNS